MIAARNVGVSFGSRPVLAEVTFDVPGGQFLCIVGPSGCGKTTLLRVLAGLIAPSEGEVAVDGKPVRGPARSRAIVFQDYTKALLPWRTVAGNVALGLEACGVAEPQRSERVQHLLGKMGLGHCTGHYPAQLSGGMQQRV